VRPAAPGGRSHPSIGTDADEAPTVLAGSVDVPGVVFRRFGAEGDTAAMVSVSRDSWRADGIEWSVSQEQIEDDLADRDPARDLILVEGDGELIGYGIVGLNARGQDRVVFYHSAHLLAPWRGRGIREALLAANERRILEMAKGSRARTATIECWAADEANEWRSIVLGAGYQSSWHVVEMLRSDLERIPDVPLPTGLEVRSVHPDEMRLVWEARREGHRDEPSFSEDDFDDAAFERWVSGPGFRPDLWQVAWDGGSIAGMVLNVIDDDANRALGRSRGLVEDVYVRPAYRRRGLGRALVARSLRVHATHGMDEVGLDATAENPHGAIRLYQSLGFAIERSFTFYRKSLV